MENLDLRILISQQGIRYKDIADEMNISREWLSRLMRFPLSTENRLRILRAVEKLKGAENDADRRIHGE